MGEGGGGRDRVEEGPRTTKPRTSSQVLLDPNEQNMMRSQLAIFKCIRRWSGKYTTDLKLSGGFLRQSIYLATRFEQDMLNGILKTLRDNDILDWIGIDVSMNNYGKDLDIDSANQTLAEAHWQLACTAISKYHEMALGFQGGVNAFVHTNNNEQTI